MSIKIQAITMLMMVACGLTMGLLYDTYRVMKGQTGLRGWLVIICDLLFWASCIFLVFGTLLRINDGIVRVYLFLGMGIGAWAYFALFHSFYVKWFLRFIQLVKAIYRFIINMIQTLIIKPVIFLYKVIITVIVTISLFVWKIILFIYGLFQKIFVPLGTKSSKLGKKIYSGSKKKGAGILKRLAKLIKLKRKDDIDKDKDE
ncbi:spore cortex biosynthesis protein YabQ [Ammoniphilus sp. CFH 90114]|uniref:spore cortex biosynthesis protein YabQ n=1 Tax=Ammoniphilus sp. CFH 90114 TaxID=2493665 RepID=UPI00100E51BE|nr:spore cortex biosynthesis protein YabQ [Ammoniphilus sp. CFH 90114]RXT09013.1 spore cortex biosynthesis protein YabQ [Ammoniphilus sp. CFH 90114]